MNCPLLSEATADLLLKYSAGRLEAWRASGLGRHVAGCRECAAFLVEQGEVWAALDAWETPAVSPGFNRVLFRRLEEAGDAPWYRKVAEALRFGAWKPAVPLTAAMALVVAGFVFDHRGPALPGSALAASGMSVADMDQVERTLDDIQLLHQFDVAAAQQPL